MLNDNSPMPFGKHVGKPMEKVPASYLIWLGEQMATNDHLTNNQKAVQSYIDDNWDVLNKEVND